MILLRPLRRLGVLHDVTVAVVTLRAAIYGRRDSEPEADIRWPLALDDDFIL